MISFTFSSFFTFLLSFHLKILKKSLSLYSCFPGITLFRFRAVIKTFFCVRHVCVVRQLAYTHCSLCSHILLFCTEETGLNRDWEQSPAACKRRGHWLRDSNLGWRVHDSHGTQGWNWASNWKCRDEVTIMTIDEMVSLWGPQTWWEGQLSMMSLESPIMWENQRGVFVSACECWRFPPFSMTGRQTVI